MANFIKSKVQQSLSFLLMLVIAFSAFSGVLFVNPSSSYAYDQTDLDRALGGDPYLREADLRGALLREADLRGALLREADLSGANLHAARLSAADLIGANLSGADLTYADLSGANLSGTDLGNVDLSSTDLSDAIADSKTKFPDGFNAKGLGVTFYD